MKIELWKNDLLSGITFANNSYSHHSFQPHFHDHYTIMIVDKGVNEGVCEKKKYHVTSSDILLINPGEIHTGNSYQGKYLQYSALYVYVDFFVKHQLSEHGCSPPVFTKLLERNAGLAERIKELFQCTRSGTDPLEIEEKKVRVFWELLNYSEKKRHRIVDAIDRVQRLKTFIKEQYKQQFSLTSLTDFAGLSPYHLIRSFKQAVGMTPFQFLRNYRIERAKLELLRKKTIAQVAVEVGFYDQSHFHKHFKLVTGFTPREFQRQ